MDTCLIDTAADPRRLVVLDAVHNFRDLGGYPARDGLTTRWGRLYRADGLHRLTRSDVELVRGLGLRTVIDLRTQVELDQYGWFPYEAIPVTYTHLSIMDTTWNTVERPTETEHEFLVWAYADMLDQGAERFARALAELAVPGALPAVFHCAAGKDRTGMLAALLLAALEVPRAIVLADYALTAGGIERMRSWALREFPEMSERMAETPSQFMAALPDALGEVLDALAERYGSVAEYLQSIGVGNALLDRLADELLGADVDASPLTSLA